MKTILIKEGCPNPISLGEKGENGVSAVLFDYSEWISDFGEGAISLLVKRKGDASAYPVVLDTADGIATWTISNIDTDVQGYGKAEYIFTIDEKVAKSTVFSFFVAADLGPSGDPPDPYESWIDTLTALGGETLINAQRAEAAESGAEAAQTAAETAAQNAESSATAAAQSAGSARDMAASALQSADRATASATAASASATQAAESATTASNAATSATQSANNAAQSASTASLSATQASNSALSANDSATSAETFATEAAESESNAAQSATEAEASAQEAATEAAKLNNYLPTDTASGSIASFTDGAKNMPVKALSVALEPVQDLHGYSNPWPVGGSANKLPCGEAFTQTINGITITSDGTGIYTITGTATAAVNYLFDIPEVTLPDTVIVHLMNDKAGSTGSAIGFDWYNGSTRVDFVGLYPVNRIYFGTSALGGKTINKLAIRVASGESISGTLTFSPMILDTNATTPFIPCANICPITGHSTAQVWREATYDTTAQPQITIPLGQTVYGGTLDVVQGVLTVDRAMVELTGSDDWYSFSVGTASASAICNLPSAPYVPTAGSGFNGAVSSIGLENPRYWASARPNETPDKGNWSFAIGSGVVRVYTTDITAVTSLALFKSAFQASQYCYTLATPIEIPLTAHDLTTLLGQNNIWSDSGDVDVTYRADIQKYITKVIAEAIS